MQYLAYCIPYPLRPIRIGAAMDTATITAITIDTAITRVTGKKLSICPSG